MAEVLGIISGAIAVVDFTTKIGGAGISLKRLWDEFNDIPYTLLRKAEQVQEWDELFDEAERQISPDAPPALLRNKALLHKHAAKFRTISAELQVIIDQLLDKSTHSRRYRRKIGAAKAVLRKEEIKAIDDKLEEALKQFQFSLSLYTAATLITNPILAIQRQPEDLARLDEKQSEGYRDTDASQDITSTQKTHTETASESTEDKVVATSTDLPNVLAISHRRTIFGRLGFSLGSSEGFQFSLRTPDWLSSSVYSVMASKASKGWDFHLRAYEVIPSLYTTDLIAHFENDDALEILRFLDEKRMTPFVRDMDGRGLLHLACHFSSINFMSLLLERGTKLSASSNDTADDVRHGSCWLWHLLLRGFEAYTSLNRDLPYPAQKILQLLRSHDMDENAFNNPGGDFVSSSSLPPNVLSNLMEDEYYCIPVKQRLEDARRAYPVIDFEPFLSWLPELKHDPCNLLQTSREPGMFSFIHTIASLLPFADDNLRHNRYLSITSHPWFEPFCKYIASDPEGIFHIEDWANYFAGDAYNGGQTPFSLIVNAIVGTLGYNTTHARTQEPLQLWITALLSCGVELLAYGRYEQANYRQQAVTYSRRNFNNINSRKATVKSTLIGMTYGSQVEHWKLWFAFEYEDYAGDFWSMVEQSSAEDPVLKVPGSWVEESMDPEDVEWEELREWTRDEPPPLIWSEYRKIRPPT